MEILVGVFFAAVDWWWLWVWLMVEVVVVGAVDTTRNVFLVTEKFVTKSPIFRH